jgi:long-chain fatty acid transport protein
MRHSLLRVSLLSAVCVAALSGQANAAAFYLQEQSVSGLGTAFAGSAADTPDASTIFYNPAGMTDLDGMQIYLGANVLFPSADFDNEGSTIATPGTGGAAVPIVGNDGGNPFDAEVLPQLYIAAPLWENRLWAGVGVSTPFGLANEYDEGFVGRYNSTKNELRTIDIEPAIAYKVNNWLSVGGGLSIQYVDANLQNAIPHPGLGGPSTATDGRTRLTGDDWSTSVNFGLLVKPTDTTRIGINYREGTSHTLKGDVDTTLPTTLGGATITVPGSAELDLPNMIQTGISQKVTDRLTLLGSVNWYEWSNFNDIPIFADGGLSISEQGYENTWGFAVGARYRLNEQWLLKTGVQYDQTPTVTEFRSTRIPDGDRLWFAAGATYSLTQNIDLDFSGAYITILNDKRIDITDNPTAALGVATSANTVGDSGGDVFVGAAAVKFKF